ncbi:MAG TPA: hypothetical protein VHV32_11635 [Candidatus Angelobacter sp.]|jgi:hypothetical protein|nr:hypothetical protein [Candidatus Angelobacter sp.]
MNRRDLLKALGFLPMVGVLQGCTRRDSDDTRPPSKEPKIHTLQILLEGAFAVVLQKQSQRLTAFVPLPDPGRKDLEHYFCFNDPEAPKKLSEKTKEFRFELPGEGLHTYYGQDGQQKDIEPYLNPGFDDFNAEVDKWFLPPSLVILDLPFPRSLNFSGRPLNVKFGKKALKPFGKMPTNYILEYRVDDEQKVQLKCNQDKMQCSPSPHCPPGVLRYFFGVGPINHDPKKREEHAVDFFNLVILKKAFPQLQDKYEIASIEASDFEEPGVNSGLRPVAFNANEETSPATRPAVLSPGNAARLLPVASLVDCQIGGILVRTSTSQTG